MRILSTDMETSYQHVGRRKVTFDGDGMQRVSTEVEVSVPSGVLKDCKRSRSNVVNPVAVSVDGLQLEVSVNIKRDDEKKLTITLDLTGVPVPNEVLVDGDVLKYVKPRKDDESSESEEDSYDTEDDVPGAKRKVRKFSVKQTGNGRLVRMLLSDAYAVTARLTVTHVRSLGACLHVVRGMGELCDVVLRAAGRDFPAHKVVLSAASPVFLRMFTGDFVEGPGGAGEGSATATASQARVVEIKEVFSAAAFEKLLEFLYTGSVADFSDLEVELLGLADRYIVEKLREACIERLMEVDKERVVATLRAAVEWPFVPKEVRLETTRALLNDWEELTATAAWKAFRTAHPVAAALLGDAWEVYEN
ncbi:speckle-type POZ protein-like isoform X4 [Thrips palmi]|uniref:Speckle-type POZ protein-like isoform X4 n=1 Tax=Thrips palmi TaxID=161013 RepID=A0A6P8Z088_THRPL|nr:speckle-type POZ protein-like isoform X4 [Thrips palmi]